MINSTVKSDREPFSTFTFLKGGGELGELIRSFPWQNTSLGTPDKWPQSLKTILSVLVNNRFPQFLWWGPELIQFYNDAYRPSLGNTGKHPAVGQRGDDCWPEIWLVIKPLIDQVLSGGEATWSEDQLIPIYRNGQLEDVYWTFCYSPVNDETGNPAGVLVTCYETTEKVLNLRKLEESERNLRFAIDAAELGTWDYNPGGAKFFCNNRLRTWLGLNAEGDLDISSAIAAVIEKDRGKVIDAIKRALDYSTGGYYNIEYTISNLKTHQQRTVCAKGKAWFNNEHIAYRFNGTVQDVTEQTTARKKIEESELLSQSIIKNSDAAQILYLGEDMILCMINDRMLEIIGRDSSIIGKPLVEAIPELQGTQILDRLRSVLHTGVPFYQSEEMFVLHRQGIPHTGFYNYLYKPMMNTAGEIYGVICTAVEVTEQVTSRKKIEETREKAELAISSAELGTYELDLITGELRTDPRADAIWGISEPGSAPKYSTMIHLDDRQSRLKAFAEAMRTGQLCYEARLINSDNSIRWVKVNGKVLHDADGRATCIIGVVQDITASKHFTDDLNRLVLQRTEELEVANKELMTINRELKEANELLVQSRNSLEQFNYAASHDLQEPLRKIETFINLFRDEIGNDLTPKGEKYITKTVESVRLMRRIISDVMSYSHRTRSDQQLVKVDLNEELRIVKEDLDHLIIKSNATIESDPLPEIVAVRAQMAQLFLNLISNALKFSRKNVPPKIAITCFNLEPLAGKNHPGLNPSLSYFQINFKDNGIGFEQEYSERVFELFKRLHNKSTYEGTGIGLPLCKKIVETHKGDISVISQIDVGSTFQVILPYSPK